ncbi:MAG: serine/threonine protein kinase [Myxococcales bacterium]|nr:serine/threonine protein kinase [Myxococcales bacterium]
MPQADTETSVDDERARTVFVKDLAPTAAAPASGSFASQFGRYWLLERLGRGGMAEVWKACVGDVKNPEGFLVIKKILPQFARSAYFVSLFRDESRLSARLTHPNVVRVYGRGVIGGIDYLAMEHLDGVDLGTILVRLRRLNGKVPPSVAAFIACEVARALAYAHKLCDESGEPMNLIHRDVSPENIMLLRDGRVKLLDFGIALFDQRSPRSITQAKTFKGKAAYSSPEQVAGDIIDDRSDVFSLGVVMWEMLTGQRLFGGGDHATTVSRLMRAEIPPVSRFAPTVFPTLEVVVQRALSRSLGRRYQSAHAMVKDLEAILIAHPLDAQQLHKTIEGAPLTEAAPALAEGDPRRAAACLPPARDGHTSFGAASARRGIRLTLCLAALVVAGLAAWPFTAKGRRLFDEQALELRPYAPKPPPAAPADARNSPPTVRPLAR